MYKLIKFALDLMEKENQSNPENLPSQNTNINITQNPEINPNQNFTINSSQNRSINPTQDQNWKKNQWKLFKETIIWEYLNDNQKLLCKKYLQSL